MRHDPKQRPLPLVAAPQPKEVINRRWYETLRARLEGLPKSVRDIAWKAQVRLCSRYRRLSATGKKLPIVVAAIAREMAAFLWAIGREAAPT